MQAMAGSIYRGDGLCDPVELSSREIAAMSHQLQQWRPSRSSNTDGLPRTRLCE